MIQLIVSGGTGVPPVAEADGGTPVPPDTINRTVSEERAMKRNFFSDNPKFRHLLLRCA